MVARKVVLHFDSKGEFLGANDTKQTGKDIERIIFPGGRFVMTYGSWLRVMSPTQEGALMGLERFGRNYCVVGTPMSNQKQGSSPLQVMVDKWYSATRHDGPTGIKSLKNAAGLITGISGISTIANAMGSQKSRFALTICSLGGPHISNEKRIVLGPRAGDQGESMSKDNQPSEMGLASLAGIVRSEILRPEGYGIKS